MIEADDDGTTPPAGGAAPHPAVSRAPPPIRPLRGSPYVAVSKRPADFVTPSIPGFVPFPDIPKVLAANAAAWGIPPDRQPAVTDLAAHARPIEDALSASREQAAGIDSYSGQVVWVTAAAWRIPAFVAGMLMSAALAALHGNTIRLPTWNGYLDCYPILSCRSLALIFGAENPPEAPPQSALDEIRNFEKPPSRTDRSRGAAPTGSGRKNQGGKSYDQCDEPLLNEMAEFLENRAQSSAWAAAVHVAPRAVGGGTLDAKAKRLLGKFQKRSALNSPEQH